ncbi:MAG: hypothetical protein LBM02_01735, partial [Lachnospiraceae bacterium]|nr:hypothetical protein [Lachnospiraceae bacterium]
YVKFLQTQLQSDEKDEKKLEAQLTEIITKQAKDSIKQNLVADAIAKKEKLEPSEKEYKKELKNVAKDYSMTDVDQLEQAAKQAWPDNYKDQLKSMVNLKIVTNWLAEHCIQEKASTTSSESK